MVKLGFFLIALCVSAFPFQSVYAQSVTSSTFSAPKRCGTTEHLAWRKQQDPSLQARMDKIETKIQTWMKYPQLTTTTNSIVYIPVVVHVVYNNANATIEDIPDSLVQKQIDVLNRDFSRTNTDWTNTPSVWQPLVADCGIQFCLASKDPNGNPTTGILHKSRATTSWSTNDNVKYTISGGDDAWPASNYLNIWVCNLTGELGYTSPPGSSGTADGVVVRYSTLPGGTYCCSPNNYDLGRTLTHEVGHWLNLFHIWGDDGGACTGSDLVSDTPNQGNNNYACPTFPHVSCSNGPDGDMFMNYMDYTDDNCLYMFTNGQSQRMQATLNVIRPSILTSAASNCPTGTVVNNLPSSDNISIFPNPSTGEIFINTGSYNINAMDLKVYNVIGQILLSKKINLPSIKVDLSNSPDGIYLFEIKTPEGNITKKIILNR